MAAMALVRPLVLFFIALFFSFGLGNHHDHQHAHLLWKKHSALHHKRAANDTLLASNLTSPELILARAHALVAERNKARLENPAFNKHEFGSPEELVEQTRPAPPLDIDAVPLNGTLRRRQDQEGEGEEEDTQADPSPYTLPPEVIEAARLVAESTPQIPTGDQADVAAAIREKYSHKLADTNRPPQLKKPEGKLSVFGDGVEYGSNVTAGSSSTLSKRDDEYWMVEMAQLGEAPYAPSGYQVWRNVMDFGAVGDGVTDDTAAIQLAISSGSRCGNSCNSSTIVPAVVYFPPGTYLVSSTIVQYYNTQFLGDPHNVPTLLAATSFTGGAVISSNVYLTEHSQWYLNTANFMRSVRNFKIDLRIAPHDIYLAGIHWQVAQASSLENIEFYMRYNSETPGNTQQGIYMENGSGGFLADLIFVGGNYGAYMGNQQFTTSHLVFVGCETAVQIHWDWAWTMHDYIIESCNNGVIVAGGAGGPGTQGVGSLVLVDSVIANTANGIITTLLAENSTSFLLQNVGFFNVWAPIVDSATSTTLVPAADQIVLENWGFGQINNVTGGGSSQFVNGENITAMAREPSLLGASYDHMAPNFFTRRRPKYYSVPESNIMNVKALGALGDGETDDTAVLNSILAGAANTSSIVYFPYGVYIVTDTLRIPIGSRIIGQAWSQIMGKGVKFQNELAPRPVVQVGRPGDVGIIEIQDMMFTVSGPTAGAVVVEWNAAEESTGSVGMWDTHIRVGGAAGSDLQLADCPKLSGIVNPDCKAASLLMHLKPGSTVYMENAWLWVADHDLETVTKDQIDIYTGRGLLVESDRAWLWATASEHCVLYQYQFSNASNIFMSMIQTESPYFQPTPHAPAPFQPGLFPNDPTFADCAPNDHKCFTSWAVRIVDSTKIYMLGAGLYSWFYNYDQQCVVDEDCQNKGFEVEQSFDVWIYNLCTKAMIEMISPFGSTPTLAADNVNGFLSSILAWLQGANDNVSGPRNFPGFQVHDPEFIAELEVPAMCKTALAQTVVCDAYVSKFVRPGYRGSLDNVTRTNSVCDSGCGESLKSWIGAVETSCTGYNISGADPVLPGGRMWAGYNETCLVDPADPGVYCNDVIDAFTDVATIDLMPTAEICSFCFTERLAMMQRSPYSGYDEHWQAELEYVNTRCSLSHPTDLRNPPYFTPENPYDECITDTWYTPTAATTCDEIAEAHNISSASLFMSNQNRLADCAATSIIDAGTSLCLPPPCDRIQVIVGATIEECFELEANLTNLIAPGDIARYNPFVGAHCQYFNTTAQVLGHVLCLGPPYGTEYELPIAGNDTTTPKTHDGYTYDIVAPPDGATVPNGTATLCGKWHVATPDDDCTTICVGSLIPIELFIQVNADLGPTIADCTPNLQVDNAYCVQPHYLWNMPPIPTETEEPPHSSSTVYSSGIPTSAATTTTTTEVSSSVDPSATPTPTGLTLSPDGSCGSGVTCEGSGFGDCCSQYGWCGDTAGHCGSGCQVAFGVCDGGLAISLDGSCGEGVTCEGSAFGDCCSQYGWCGSSEGHCGTGCQDEFGVCD